MFTIQGSEKRGFCVLEDGGVLYDLLETRDEARKIVTAIKQVGSTDWDAIQHLVNVSVE